MANSTLTPCGKFWCFSIIEPISCILTLSNSFKFLKNITAWGLPNDTQFNLKPLISNLDLFIFFFKGTSLGLNLGFPIFTLTSEPLFQHDKVSWSVVIVIKSKLLVSIKYEAMHLTPFPQAPASEPSLLNILTWAFLFWSLFIINNWSHPTP